MVPGFALAVGVTLELLILWVLCFPDGLRRKKT